MLLHLRFLVALPVLIGGATVLFLFGVAAWAICALLSFNGR